jgi:hypothetical protein
VVVTHGKYTNLFSEHFSGRTGKLPPVPIKKEAGWDPELVWMLWRRENLSLPPEIEPRFLSHPARRL